jgi:hypothetical protein
MDETIKEISQLVSTRIHTLTSDQLLWIQRETKRISKGYS